MIRAVRQARHPALSLLLAIITLESLILFASELYLPAQAWFEVPARHPLSRIRAIIDCFGTPTPAFACYSDHQRLTDRADRVTY